MRLRSSPVGVQLVPGRMVVAWLAVVRLGASVRMLGYLVVVRMMMGVLGGVVGLLLVIGVPVVVVGEAVVVLEGIVHHVVLELVLLVDLVELFILLLLAGFGGRRCGEVGVVGSLLVRGERVYRGHQRPGRLVLDRLVLLGLPLRLRPRSDR